MKKKGKNPTGLNSSMQKKIDKLSTECIRKIFIQKIKMKITEADLALVKECEKLARARCERGKHHLYCLILGESGEFYHGIQITLKRAASEETCAEQGAIMNLLLTFGDIAVSVVVVHFMPIPGSELGGVTSIMVPCPSCQNRLRHLQERQKSPIGVLLMSKGELIKISSSDLGHFHYPVGY